MKRVISVLALMATLTVGAFAQKATINLNYKVGTNDAKNSFVWSADGKTVKDGFDAASGASIAKSTTEFNAIRFDSTGKAKATPAGLRAFVLYPVANKATAESDDFTISADGKVVTIRFVHRGTAYLLTTDAKGKLDMASGFQIAEGLCDNVGGKFIVKDEYLVAGADNTSMKSIDWSKVTYKADVADANATYKYTGALDVAYKNGVVTMKGTLVKSK